MLSKYFIGNLCSGIISLVNFNAFEVALNKSCSVSKKERKTCCALHNWLLEVDGLDESWTGEWGDHDPQDVKRTIDLINQRLNSNEMNNKGDKAPNPNPNPNPNKGDKAYDCSGMGAGPSTTWRNTCDDEEQNITSPEYIRNVGFFTFRNYLVNHFDYLFRHNQVSWPPRHGLMPMSAK
jgi:hypothetical protein